MRTGRSSSSGPPWRSGTEDTTAARLSWTWRTGRFTIRIRRSSLSGIRNGRAENGNGRSGRPGRNLARNILDLNGAGWHLLIGDRGNLYLYDIADRTEKVLPEAGSFAFGAFLEDGRQVLCHRGNTVFVFDAESGKLRGKKEFPGAIDRVYLTGGNTFAAVRGTSAVLCRVKPVPRAPE